MFGIASCNPALGALLTWRRGCHALRRHAAADAPDHAALAVVLNDGRVAVTELNPESAGPLSVLPSGLQAAPRHVLAASAGDSLVVATQTSPGTPVTLRVLRAAPSVDGAGLATVKSLSVPCPGGAAGAAGAVLSGLSLSSAFALLQWSSGHATAVHGLQGGAATPLRPATFPLAEAVSANGPSSSAPSSSTPATGASARKRKTAGTADGGAAAATRPRVLCAAVDEGQFIVLDLESAAAASQVCYSLHDAQFGCPLASGAVELDAPLLSLEPAQCAVVAAGPEATVLRLGGAVHVLTVRTQPVSLLSLVARLSVSAAATAGSGTGAASKVKRKPVAAAVGGRNVAAALVALPPPVSFDASLLSGDGGGGAAAAAGDDMTDAVLQSVPAAAISRQEDICNSLVDQLSAVQPPAAPPAALLETAVSYIAGRRQHAMGVPPQLLSLTARGLAAAAQWQQLGTLLSYVPQGGLYGCSDVLVAAAAAQQYDMLPRLAVCLDEVDPGPLVTALQLLLAPTTQSNLAARRQHYASLRASAEARVAEAEAASAAGGDPAGGALALAQCAAAAVDGFSFREALLHPLLAIPTDSPAVQVALRRLGGPAADALLGYLAKWLDKYTGGALGELVAGVVLPQELLFPYYHQVLEWTRMTIDSHLTRLLMARGPMPALEAIEAALARAVEGTRRLVTLRGALEHIQAAAPLPSAHIAVATQYTAEVLDLRVR
ncbi:hypothetical protein GPECTOR_1g360 [Gonium pectorale]|uniref:Uncharacterized protein n=1 Tax=Gonium pectorale TaxID=33097 RepID=A0A150H2Z1_GONPE|nr:hypothetical protein GPECTOR_1g360 [Gonium pectorale]|eukprot:KXZ56405.1 hypothetical protein GPECTOR_1g360 [Gonium pectorale]